PDGPQPAPDARQAAMTEALLRFDQKHRAHSQGILHDPRLKQQTASSTPPSRRSSAMPRARHLIAASLAVLVAGSALGLYLHTLSNEFPVASSPPEMVARPGPAKIAAERVQQYLPTSDPPPRFSNAYAPQAHDQVAQAPASGG